MYIHTAARTGPTAIARRCCACGGPRTGLGAPAAAGVEAMQRIEDAIAPPYRWICALDVSYPAHGSTRPLSRRATGVLISPRHVLTTASVIGDTFVPERRGGPPLERVEARKIVITPGLDRAPRIAGRREPVGSVAIGTGDWWMPDRYLPSGFTPYDLALLILPRELPASRGMPFGYWSGPQGPTRTLVSASTATSLGGALVTVAGYPSGPCTTPCEACQDGEAPAAFSVPTQFSASPWMAFGRVQPARAPLQELGVFSYAAPTCSGMTGGPIWQNDGGLRLVGLHQFDDFRPYRPMGDQGLTRDRWSVGLALRPELLDLMRQRMARDGVRASF